MAFCTFRTYQDVPIGHVTNIAGREQYYNVSKFTHVRRETAPLTSLINQPCRLRNNSRAAGRAGVKKGGGWGWWGGLVGVPMSHVDYKKWYVALSNLRNTPQFLPTPLGPVACH